MQQNQSSTQSLPLNGVRVLDLSRVFAGPMCAMALGDMGAEVIKVEHPQRGDDTRDWGLRLGPTNTTYFDTINRNKKSITLDLKTPEAQDIVKELVKKSDVVIQNFKYGAIEKMGLGYEELKKINPGIVYCSITGYNHHTPEAARPGYDLVIQGEAGLMGLNGEFGQGPLKFGVAVVDMFTGMHSAQAILAALFDRFRTQKGRHIQMALYDCGLLINSYYGMDALVMQEDPQKYGNAHPSIMPYGVFEAQDGPLVIAVGNNAQFARFCAEVIQRPDLAADERFKTNTSRAEHRDILRPILLEEIAKHTRTELLHRLTQAGIPCGEVLGILDALKSERTQQAGLLSSTLTAEGKEKPVLCPPYQFDGERAPVRYVAPTLGQDTQNVLQEVLGLSADAIKTLAQKQII